MQSGNISGIGIYNGKRYIKYIYDTEGVQFLQIDNTTYELVKDIFGNVVMVVNQEEGEVACVYRYDALGNCTVLKADGTEDTNRQSVGNTNPFRWKSFYYDPESKFYYANGSYFDPQTGLYVDAAPVMSVVDNAFTTRSLDRNAPMCDNILEFAGNPYTVATATNLSPDPNYDLLAHTPWLLRLSRWYAKQHWAVKLGVGIVLLRLAAVFTYATGGGGAGIAALLAQVAFGVGIGVGMWALSTALTGGEITLEGIANAALDAFLASAAIAFICAGINYLKYVARSKAIPTAELQESTIKDMSYNDMLPNEKVAYDGYSAHGWQGNYPGQARGISAGGVYKNKTGILPQGLYHEFDINPAIPGIGRDASRFVVSNDYVVYLTRDHYVTFFRILK